jgi:hypothetical protein
VAARNKAALDAQGVAHGNRRDRVERPRFVTALSSRAP